MLVATYYTNADDGNCSDDSSDDDRSPRGTMVVFAGDPRRNRSSSDDLAYSSSASRRQGSSDPEQEGGPNGSHSRKNIPAYSGYIVITKTMLLGGPLSSSCNGSHKSLMAMQRRRCI